MVVLRADFLAIENGQFVLSSCTVVMKSKVDDDIGQFLDLVFDFLHDRLQSDGHFDGPGQVWMSNVDFPRRIRSYDIQCISDWNQYSARVLGESSR